jgi:hypothetical protein
MQKLGVLHLTWFRRSRFIIRSARSPFCLTALKKKRLDQATRNCPKFRSLIALPTRNVGLNPPGDREIADERARKQDDVGFARGTGSYVLRTFQQEMMGTARDEAPVIGDERDPSTEKYIENLSRRIGAAEHLFRLERR